MVTWVARNGNLDNMKWYSAGKGSKKMNTRQIYSEKNIKIYRKSSSFHQWVVRNNRT